MQVGKVVQLGFWSNSQIHKLIQKGVKGVKRIHYKNLSRWEKPHIHFDGGSAVNIDGTFKHVGKPLTNAQKRFLESIVWELPK